MRDTMIILMVLIGFTSCSKTLTGELTEITTYYDIPTSSESRKLAIFTSLKKNLPASILAKNGQLYLIDISPNVLADFATEQLKIQGNLLKKKCIIKPYKIWVRDTRKWKLIYKN